jgi:hypothetical protein
MTISTISGPTTKAIRSLAKNRLADNTSASTNGQSVALINQPTGQKSNTGEAKTRRLKKQQQLSTNVESVPSSDRIKEKLRQNESRKQKSII